MSKRIQYRRRILFERLEPRYAMDGAGIDSEPYVCPEVVVEPGSEWQNVIIPTDVNQDNVISPIDVLILINAMNDDGVRMLDSSVDTAIKVDVNGDGHLTPSDLIAVINELNEPGRDTAVAIAEARYGGRPHGAIKPVFHELGSLEYSISYCTSRLFEGLLGEPTAIVTPSTGHVEWIPLE